MSVGLVLLLLLFEIHFASWEHDLWSTSACLELCSGPIGVSSSCQVADREGRTARKEASQRSLEAEPGVVCKQLINCI